MTAADRTPIPGSPGAVLAAARDHQWAARAAEAGLLAAALEWASLHAAHDLADAASWWLHGEVIPLAGEGCPEVAAWAVPEFAAAVGLTTDAGRRLIGQALELAWRLPTLWEQVQEGRVPAWRARRVADATMPLNRVAAGFVGRQVAAVAGKVSLPQLDRLITEAKVRHEAAERPDPSDPCPTGPDARRVDVRTDLVTFDGTVPVVGELDLADALHLDQALTAGAEQLRIAGSADTLDARRAVALGEMSRAQLALTLDPADDTAVTSGRPVRPATLFLHLSDTALTGASPVGRCENTATPINAETIRAWCGHPDTLITVRPILDLAEHVRVDQYEIPDRLRAQVDHRDGGCVFPWCTRPARACDHDHREPYDPHDRQGDPARGPTCSCNLAPLCRHHHRLKTHTPWRYRSPEPGVYLWRSPHGYQFLRDPSGTTDVTPPGTHTPNGCPSPGHPPDR